MLTVAAINYETPDLIAACVSSVRAAPPSEPYELLIVDNGSSAATVDALRPLEDDVVRLVETGVNGGFAAGVNRCVAEADVRSDVVVVLNSDTEVEPGALDGLAAASRRERVAMAAPLLLERDGSVQRSAHRHFPTLWSTWVALCLPAAYVPLLLERWRDHPSQLSAAEHEAGARPRHVMGAAMAFQRAAWEAVGPFDERFFMYLEESDWQERAQAAGWVVELEPAARVRHLHRGGEADASVPSLLFLDSARLYFGARGWGDRAIRGVLASALAISALALALYRPLTRRASAHRAVVDASLPQAWRGVMHLLRGRTVKRPTR